MKFLKTDTGMTVSSRKILPNLPVGKRRLSENLGAQLSPVKIANNEKLTRIQETKEKTENTDEKSEGYPQVRDAKAAEVVS